MSNRGAAGTVERIRTAIDDSGVTRTWLSAKTGIAYSTLTRKLTIKPGEFRLDEICAISDALGLAFDATFIPVAQADAA